MANTQAMATSFKVEMLNGHHAFGVSVTRGGTGADTFKAALYFTVGNLGESTTVYSTTDEITDASYTAGGINITNATVPAETGTTAFWTPSGTLQWTSFTEEAFDAVLFYNSTQSNKAVAVFNFGNQTVDNGTFTLNMPTNDATTGLIRIA